MSLRGPARDLVLGASATLGLDAVSRALERRSGACRVRVVNLHGTPQRCRDAFARQLEWACRHFRPIDFATLKRWMADPARAASEADGRTAVLFTFDDGLASNHEVAAPLLEEHGTRGVFFVVPAYSETRGEAARRFHAERIRSELVNPGLAEEDWSPMDPDQVGDLAERGHTIGNHTLSHSRLAELPAERQREELEGAAERLERWIGRPVEAFAWTFVWNSIDPKAWALAAERHPFCFAPCAGLTDPARDDPRLVWRTYVEATEAPAEFRFRYSGLTDWYWRKQRARLRSMRPA